jgi:hypothetical protein
MSDGSKVVDDVLGNCFKGMLVSDCLSSYDPCDYAKHPPMADSSSSSHIKGDTAAWDAGYGVSV